MSRMLSLSCSLAFCSIYSATPISGTAPGQPLGPRKHQLHDILGRKDRTGLRDTTTQHMAESNSSSFPMTAAVLALAVGLIWAAMIAFKKRYTAAPFQLLCSSYCHGCLHTQTRLAGIAKQWAWNQAGWKGSTKIVGFTLLNNWPIGHNRTSCDHA